MTFLKSFFEDSPGVGSMMRLVHWWAFVFCIALPTLVWLAICWQHKAMIPLDSTISTFCLGGFGSATIGKVAQAYTDNKTP